MTGINWAIFGLILVIELLLGVIFAALVWKIGPRKEGYTALFVVVGVLFTLAGVAVFNWQGAVLAVIFFIATGTPMVVADIARYITLREQAKRFEKEKTEPIMREIYHD